MKQIQVFALFYCCCSYTKRKTQRFTQANDDPFTHYPRWYRKHPWIACPYDRVGNTRKAPFVGYG